MLSVSFTLDGTEQRFRKRDGRDSFKKLPVSFTILHLQELVFFFLFLIVQFHRPVTAWEPQVRPINVLGLSGGTVSGCPSPFS